MQINFDMRDFKRVADKLGVLATQIPYAVSRAQNKAAYETRRVLAEQTWPAHVTQRRSNYPGVALHVEESTKHNLTVKIVEQSKTPSLQAHAEGGTRVPSKAKRFAIPLKGWVQRSAEGVPTSMQARYIISHTSKRALRVTTKGIFVGEGGRLHLRYSFQPSTTLHEDVPFYEVFASEMRSRVNALLPRMLQEAMATARR
jgi:hypothetical protein